MGINVPIIPGIKLIAIKKHLNLLSQAQNRLPEALIKAVEACKNNNEVKQVGIEWVVQQSKELKAAQEYLYCTTILWENQIIL